jgi:hypothetical protein
MERWNPGWTWMSPDAFQRTWMPAIHAGMTKKTLPYVFLLCSAADRKLMKGF